MPGSGTTIENAASGASVAKFRSKVGVFRSDTFANGNVHSRPTAARSMLRLAPIVLDYVLRTSRPENVKSQVPLRSQSMQKRTHSLVPPGKAP